MNNEFDKSEWIEDRFKNFAVLQRGKDLTDNEVISGDYPVVKSNGIDIYHNEYFVEPPGVVTGRSGTIGNAFFITEKFWAHNTTLYVKDFKGNDPKFIYYLIASMRFDRYLAGTTVPTLNRNDIHRLIIKVPSLVNEQTAIAFILSKVDEAIATTERNIKAAEKLKKAMMQNLLTGKLKPDGTWRKDDEFYVDEKFGKVPLGWSLKKLKDVCKGPGEYGANASAIEFVAGTARYIRITDIADTGNLIEEDKAGIEASVANKYLLKNNDFLFARTGDTVGKSLLYKESMGLAAYAGYLIKFTFNPKLIVPEYLDLIAKSDFFEAFKTAMKRVGAKPNINSREYGSFKFILPNDTEEQENIIKKTTPLDKQIKTQRDKIKSLQRLKKSLMQNLLTGKVRLSDNLIDKILNKQRIDAMEDVTV